ncbi:MAG TPA: malonyl-CoA decarboxylase [Microvirga sp.]|nr:malonyl-CoA decarboxylase [Microvirga sp.]
MVEQKARAGFEGAPAFLNDLIDALTERGRSLLGRRETQQIARAGGDLASLGESLLSRRGEASGVALAQALLTSYEAAGPAERLAFLQALADRFGPDRRKVEQAIEVLKRDGSAGPGAIEALHAAAEPRRQELIRRLNLAPGGTAALVRMREDLLGYLREHPDLKPVDSDFAHLFSSWFNRGFLTLRRIEWTTPANILEKIIRYEAVHAIKDWDDLRNRIEPSDRRCYGFFHPQLVDEPLIFVEVALTKDIPAAVGPLLEVARSPIPPSEATTAVFYSISNTQKGLTGVSFGNFLIKQVVEDVKRELPNLKTFVTLSPVPGFASWLAREKKADGSAALNATMKENLRPLDEAGWHLSPGTAERVRSALIPAAAYYFLKAKTPGGRPIDPVARFHLGNGARLERLNFLGDVSPNGLKQSHGLMVNYLYALDEIEKNHEAFAEKGVVAASPSVRKALPPEIASRDAVPSS